MSRQAFDARFHDEDACAQYLADRRWREGFLCPSCGTCKGWPLKRKRATWECAGCGRQTSVTAGTVMHASHLPLRTWFLAAHIMISHSNGMSALQLRAQLGLGSYKTVWFFVAEAASRDGQSGPQPSERRCGNRRNGDAVPVTARS